MPRLPIDYSNTVIYKIVCNDLSITDCYVGHTTDFTRRKQGHKNNCSNEKTKKYNYKVYETIRETGGWNNWSMIEIEKYPCKDSNEATAKEREWFERLDSSLNMNCPQISIPEMTLYKNQYYKDNKDFVFRLVTCQCGKQTTHRNKCSHSKSKFHKQYMNNLLLATDATIPIMTTATNADLLLCD